LPFPIPISFDLTPDWRALLFAAGAAALTGIAFGLAPALETMRANLTPALKEGGHIPLRQHRRLSLRNGLVLCQMSASTTLLLLTGYMGLGIQSTLGIQQGFNPRNLYLISLDPVRDGYTAGRATDFFAKLLDRVKMLPQELHWAMRHTVGRNYFETTEIPIVAGRAFRREDEKDGAPAVIVSEELVRAYWEGKRHWGGDSRSAMMSPPGVSGDGRGRLIIVLQFWARSDGWSK
jgi:hypothetical protein